MDSQRKTSAYKPRMLPNDATMNLNTRDSIGAWRGGTTSSYQQQAKRDDLLRSVDNFLASNTHQKKRINSGSHQINDRLYRTEMARDEAQAKLQEWMKVASELQEVVQQQQRQLDSTLNCSGNTATASQQQAVNPDNRKFTTSTQVAQLQNLVQSVRQELERVSAPPPPPPLATTALAAANNINNAETMRLQSEVQSLRRQLQGMQQSQRGKLTVQQEEAAALSAQVEVHRRAADTARSDHDHLRSALLDAEMELQKHKEEVCILKQKLGDQETRIQSQAKQLAANSIEIEREKIRAAEAERQVESLSKDKAEAIQLAGDATSEAGRLEIEGAHQQAQLQAAQRAAEQAQASAAAAEARAVAAETGLASENCKRGSLEAEVARMQSEILSLEATITELQRRGKADVGSLGVQLEALQEELLAAQQNSRVSRREADSFKTQVDNLMHAHAVAVAAAKDAQEKLLGLEAEMEAAQRRATHAEAKVASSLAAAAERNDAAESEAKIRNETEIKALKEVLDRVATTAQQKDSALQFAQAEVAALRVECATLRSSTAAAEQKLLETQASAAHEFKQYDSQIKAAFEAVAAAQHAAETAAAPVKLALAVQPVPEWKHGDPIPSPLQRRFDAQVQEIKEQHAVKLAAAVEEALVLEGREHAAAVKLLEEAHMANFEALKRQQQDEQQQRREQDYYYASQQQQQLLNDGAGLAAEASVAPTEKSNDPASPEHAQLWQGGASEFRRAREAAEAEAAAFRDEVRYLRERGVETQSRLRAAETELLAAQDHAARLNSAVTKLEKKVKKLKEELDEANEARDEAEEETQSLRVRVKQAEYTAATAKAELGETQEELEMMLTARITELSRPPSEVDPEEEIIEEESFGHHLYEHGNHLQEERSLREVYASYPNPSTTATRSTQQDQEQPQQHQQNYHYEEYHQHPHPNVAEMNAAWEDLDNHDPFTGVESDEDDILRQSTTSSARLMPPPPPQRIISATRKSCDSGGGPLASQAHLLYSGDNMDNQSNNDSAGIDGGKKSWTGAEADSIEPMSRSFTSGSKSFAISGNGAGAELQVSGRADSVNQLSQGQGPLEAYSSMLPSDETYASVAPSQAPVAVRQSPLKKLARILRGKKKNRNTSDFDEASTHNELQGGVVKRNLIRSADGSIQWQPNTNRHGVSGVGAGDLVLVGGGHAHVQVLRRFGMKPIPGLRVTLITPDVQTPYSGMLPGYVSGFYTYDDCHIDLVRLARFANARLVHATARGVDLSSQEVHLVDRPSLQYDIVSLNIGIAPSTLDIPGAAEYTVPVKPISTFASRFQQMLKDAMPPSSSDKGSAMKGGTTTTTPTVGNGLNSTKNNMYRVAVVGGGPSGVELACAVQYRLTQERIHTAGYNEKDASQSIKVVLISKGEILSGVAPYARNAFLPLLKERNIEVHEVNAAGAADLGIKCVGGSSKGNVGGVISVSQNALTLSDGTLIPFDTCLWSTQAGATGWLARSGLPTDERGFLRVNEYLQAENGPSNVFGAGDCTTNVANPRPKAGVYAVRAGIPLAENLAAYAQNKPLRPWHPQSSHLNLISVGNRYAIAVKGRWLGVQSAALWTWKDWIDRKFMAKFGSDLNFDEERMNKMMTAAGALSPSSLTSLGPEAAALAAASKMRCGGCGAKVGASILSRVLEKLRLDEGDTNNTDDTNKKHILLGGVSAPDDGAVLESPPPGHVTIHTVDFFKSIIEDPYIFGSIAANHALSDCYAMGATPTAALAIAVLPFASSKITEGDLYQLMAGANKVLRKAGCALVGGHSCEGAELSLGFSIYGTAQKSFLLPKSGLQPGQALILTKPLGTGVIFAACMRGLAQGRWISGAIESMLESNSVPAEVFRQFKCTACTDVTGFGLLGHLAEMCRASQVTVEVDVASVPILQGAAECIAAGAVSTLHTENAKLAAVVASNNGEEDDFLKLSQWNVLIDPQTSGGLLGAVPAEQAEACVEELRRRGYAATAVVGKVGDRISNAMNGECSDGPVGNVCVDTSRFIGLNV